MKFSLLSLLIIVVSGCVSLNSVSLTSVPEYRSKRVAAASERFIVMGFNFDNDYVNSITTDLKTQCPSGTVSGVLTKSESINYFLYIFWKSRVSATGYCVPGKMASVNNMTRKRKPTDDSTVETPTETAEPAVQ